MDMEYRPLGNCGTKVSAFGLGGWTTFGGSVKDEKLVGRIIRTAFDAGINFFDIADAYAHGEAEKAMGRVFRKLPRHHLVITSKLFWPASDDVNDRGLSRKHIFESVEKSLKRIGTDYLDIYFCHRYDDDTPLEETVRAMDDLVHQGKILYWGTSEWSGSQLQSAAQLAEKYLCYRPQVEQPQYSLLARERFEQDVRPSAERLGMGLVVWSPLASGVLTGKYDDGIPKGSRLSRIAWLAGQLLTEDHLQRVRKLAQLASDLGVSRAQLSLAWAVRQSGVSSVILGATKVKQLKENLAALAVEMTDETLAALDRLFPPGLRPAA